jgi:hypothetical protein
MARDPLRVLQAIRRRLVEQARYALGECLKAEAAVADRIAVLDDAVRRDREASEAWQEAHRFLEMSAIRVESTRAERQAIAAELAAAAAHSAEARRVVTDARTAAEAVETLIGERAAASQAEGIRREQHVLDDIGRALRAVRQSGGNS